MATWSTTHVPFVRALEAGDRWRATGYADRLSGPEPGWAPKDLGGDGGPDEEALVASGAVVLTSYPFGDPMEGVEERTGVKVLALREYEEAHPLGRAEYIKVFGWLLDCGPKADSLFGGIEERYMAMRSVGMEAADSGHSPVVFTGSEQEGRWTAPAGDGLVATLVEDAGGRYLLDPNTEQELGLRRIGRNLEMEMEQFVLLAQGADAWGKVVHAPEGWSREDARAALPWMDLADKRLFHCNTAEVDYFGSAVLEPERLLADLVSILHDRPHPEGNAVYFKPTPDPSH